jgi:tungstate transport system substrate-binding protein
MTLKNPLRIFLVIFIIWSGGLLAEENPSREFRVIFPVTSVSSGLADALAKLFEEEYKIPIKTYSLCTGDAINFIKAHEGRDQEGKEEVDAMLGHDLEAEEQFVRDGFAVNLRSVFYSDYTLVGPPEDPAKIKGITDPFKALKKIAKNKATFCSRADSSGTHSLEVRLWKKAGIKPKGDWYLKTKVGTEETLLIANRKRAYFISHGATFMQMIESIDLVPFIEDEKNLITSYEVMAINPEKFPNVKYVNAMLFIGFLTSPGIQKFIAEFGKEDFGRQIFFPLAVKTKQSQK